MALQRTNWTGRRLAEAYVRSPTGRKGESGAVRSQLVERTLLIRPPLIVPSSPPSPPRRTPQSVSALLPVSFSAPSHHRNKRHGTLLGQVAIMDS